ncbi:MAG: glycine cleavage system protein GcvH [Gammaproteobacteria bacterium]|nr:glycine cleavage system protein GcvH [Gammaproteobacteria bacterium]
MSQLPADLKYTPSHEWVRLNDDGTVTVGITDHAQEQLGDLVFVETPPPETQVTAGEACAVVESVKAASDIYAPLSGKIVESNLALAETPEAINKDAFGAGWLFRLAPEDATALEALMDADAYQAHAHAGG